MCWYWHSDINVDIPTFYNSDEQVLAKMLFGLYVCAAIKQIVDNNSFSVF